MVLSVGRLGVGTSDLNGDFTTISSVWKQKLIIEHISRYKKSIKTEQNDANFFRVLRKTILHDQKKRISSATLSYNNCSSLSFSPALTSNDFQYLKRQTRVSLGFRWSSSSEFHPRNWNMSYRVMQT